MFRRIEYYPLFGFGRSEECHCDGADAGDAGDADGAGDEHGESHGALGRGDEREGYKLRERRNAESWTEYDTGRVTSKSLSGKDEGAWEYQVQACNGAVCSGWSGSLRILVSVAPSGTLTIEPSPSLDGDYTVSWSAPVAPYDQTRLLEKVGSGAWGVVGTYLSTVTSKVFRNKPGGTYQYKTQQCLDVLNITRCSDLAGPKSVTVTGPTPATPATPTGPATSTGSHTVRWVAVTSATGYKLQERRNTESWTKYDEGTATSKALSGKKSGTWEYQVQACNGAVCSGWSGSLRILVSVAPPGTLTIEPSPSLDGDYTVSWSAPVAPYDQTRLLEKVGSGAWGVVGTYLSTVTSKVFRNKPGGTYQYKTQQCLDVLNITRCSDLAGPASVEVTRPAVPTASPDAPAVPKLTPGDGLLGVAWDAPADNGSPITGYAVRSKQHDSDKDWDEQEFVDTETSTEITDLTNGAEYAVQVQAVNAEGDSPWSESAFGTPLSTLTVPTGLTGPAGSTGTHTISWNPVTGAERYELQARLDSGTWTMHNTGEETRKAFTALGYGDWEYQVRACNGEQCSGWSAGLTVVVGPGTVPKPPKPIVTAPGDVVSGTEQKAMDKVGTLAGEFRVAESGAATYRIALPLPAGTAGATPSLGLQYNSQRGNGLLGIGWTLDGLSAISRCRQTFAQDGKAQPLTFMDKDRFCLDGQRLLLTDDSPAQTYGAPNSKYKTEIDGFLTVTAKDGSAGQPDYFEVVRKDGSVSRYGATGVSAAEQRVYNRGGTAVDKVLTWALQEVRDSVGNRIVYSYTADEQGHRISKIGYAYGSGNTARAEVLFTYEDRQDDTVGYLAGYKLQSTQRLQQVTVKSAGSTGGLVPLRKYKLRYRRIAPNATDVLSRLAGISECVGTSSVCLPETRFTWSLPETLFKTTAASALALNSDSWRPVDFSPADINGDGLTDLVWTETNNDKHRIQYALADRGTGRLQMKKFTNNQSHLEYNDDYGNANYGDNLRVHTEVVDYNADGRLDILVYSEGTDRTELHLAVPQIEGGWKLAGRGEFLFSGRYRYADLNSDGLLDAYKLVAVYGENTQVPTGYNLEVRYLKPASGQAVASDRYYAFGAAQTLTVAFAQLPPTSSSQDIDPNVLPSYFNWKTLRQSDLPLADVDGDGRADLITWGYDGTQTFDIGDQGFQPSYTLRRLEVFRQTDSGFVRYGSDGGIVLSSGQQSSIAKGVRAADLNRDGLSDLVYFVGRWYRKSSDNYQWTGDWQYRLSTGAGFTAAVTLLDVAANAQAPSSPSLHDDNGDGYADFLWHDVPTRQVRVKRWSPARGAFETRAPTRVRSASGKDDESYLTLDVNGDGNGDLLQVSTSDSRETVTTYLQSTTGRANLVRGVRNGLGAETDITYESLSTTDSYVRIAGLYSTPAEERCLDWQPGPGVYWLGLAGGGKYCYTVEAALEDADAFYEALNDPWQDLTDPVTGTSGAPVLELMGPLYVVTRVDSSAPTAADVNAKSGIGYVYEQGKVQAAGRGLLGFKSLTTVGLQTGVRTTTTYRQDFPYIGLPLETVVKTAGMDGKLLRSAVNTWRLQGYEAGWDARGSGGSTGSARLGPLQPYLEKSVEEAYDLPATVNGALTAGALLSTVTTVTAVDGYGNPTRITVTTDDHANSKRFQQVTANTYGAASDTWSKQFGRLTKTDVTRKRDEAGDGTYETTGSRTSSFTYYTTETSQKGLLHTEVRDTVMEGAKVKIPAHTTTYAYDTFGNRVQAKVQAASGSSASSRTQTRCNHNTLAYDSYGRFVMKEKDCLGRLVRRLSRYNAHGLPPQSERVINSSPLRTVSTTYSYTAGGRLYFSHGADGSYTGAAWKDCDANCPTGAAYYTETRQAGGGESREFRDALGRAVRSAVQGFDGTWIHTDTEYDHLGRVARRSEPYYAGAVAQYWTRYEYDLLGRVTRTTLPDYDAGATNSLITVRYDGLATTTTNGKGQRQVQTRNALDEVIRTADHTGTTVTHTYNTWGQVTGTRASGTGVDAVTVAMAYDGRGRRTTLTDPDRGTWTYAWNGFDELVTQTDAVGNVQALSYDGLGRVSARLDYRARQTAPVANTQWEYDPANGLGQLGEVREMPFSGHRRTHRYDRLGRPDTTTQRLGRDGTYHSKQTYDGVGRVRQVFDAARAGATWDDNVVEVQYNGQGYAYRWVDGVQVNNTSRKTYREITSRDARGTVTGEKLGGGAIHTRRVFDAKTGRIRSITGEDVLGRAVQALTYEWDLVGNLTVRGETSVGKSLKETFAYDTLNRLVQAQVTEETGETTPPVLRAAQTVRYDALGNITNKSDVGTADYVYGSTRPHAVTAAGGHTYTYDANGNVLMEAGADRRTTRRLGYTPFNKVSTITRGTHTTNFLYGADRSRIRRTDRVRTGSGTSTTTTLYLSNVEKVIAPDGSFTYKRYITDGVLIEQEHDNTGAREEEDTRYLLYDHLGSVDVITDGVGTVVQDMSFDAWGQRRAAPNWTVLALLRLTDTAHGRTTTRGFTGHEMLDAVGIIHMNGRIYDPKLGRFMQADPVIQFPNYAQSRNSYSYVLNNPLAYTDPSGYIIPIFTAIAVAIIVSVEASVLVAAALIGAGTFLDALSQGVPLGQAFLAGISAAALTFVAGAAFPDGGLGWNAATYKYLATVAAVGGITTSLQGGKFGHGFLSAGIGAAVGGIPALQGVSPGRIAARTVVSAVSAGTVSEITGGKFANGAMTAAFMSLVSSAAQRTEDDVVVTGRKGGDSPPKSPKDPRVVRPIVNFGKPYANSGAAKEALNTDILAAKNAAKNAGNPDWEYGGITVQKTVNGQKTYYNSNIVTSSSSDWIAWNGTHLLNINTNTSLIALHHYHPFARGVATKAFSDGDMSVYKYLTSRGANQLQGVYLVDKYGVRAYRGGRSYRGVACNKGIAQC